MGDINNNIARIHRLFGIILRSTHTRNSFEVFDPLLRVAKDLIGSETMLILSSEWEFSPFADPQYISDITDYIFVGLPVMESNNSLVVPLAGHELGHAIWRSHTDVRIRFDFYEALVHEMVVSAGAWPSFLNGLTEDKIRSGVETAPWGRFASLAAERICEEIFCDCVGVRLFGESYLHAFLYLTAPHVGGTDLGCYPGWRERARYMWYAHRRLGLGGMDPLVHCKRCCQGTWSG